MGRRGGNLNCHSALDAESRYLAPSFTGGFPFSRRRHGDVFIPAKTGIQTVSPRQCRGFIYFLDYPALQGIYLFPHYPAPQGVYFNDILYTDEARLGFLVV